MVLLIKIVIFQKLKVGGGNMLLFAPPHPGSERKKAERIKQRCRTYGNAPGMYLKPLVERKKQYSKKC